MTGIGDRGFSGSYESRQSWQSNEARHPLTKDQAARMMTGDEILVGALLDRSPEFAEFARKLGEVALPIFAVAHDLSERLVPIVRTLPPYLSELQKVANTSSIDRAAGVLAPTLPALASSVSSVLDRLPASVEAAAAKSSAVVVEQLALVGKQDADAGAVLSGVANTVAETDAFNDLWQPLNSGIEAAVGSSVGASNTEIASWYTFSLPYAIRLLAPSIDTVHAVSKAVSLAVVAVIANGILQSAYPEVWTQLEDLHVTPFEMLAYIMAAWVASYLVD